ncbi:MAG: AMP-binding protein [Myxococcota bacterium]
MSATRFLLACAAALWRERTLSRQGITRLQHARLARLVAHAAERVPMYRNLYAGIDPRNFELTDLPPVDKQFLMERFDDTVANRAVNFQQVQAFGRDKTAVGQALGKDLLLAMTSGTTGRVGYFLTETKAFEYLRGTLFARILRHKLANPFEVLRFGPWRRYKMAFVTATGGHYVTYLLGLRPPLLARMMMDRHAFSILTPMAQLCEELNRFQPHYLHGYPTFLEALAHEKLQGRLEIAPEVISLGSEPVTAMARTTLLTAFPRAYVSETYGTTECVCIATQCREGRLHVNEDVCILESVDAAGYPVPEGRPGTKVYITNLMAYAQPIIRYEIGDQVVINSEPCPCGFPFKTVKVLGRTDDTFYLRGEDNRFHAHTPIPFEALFLEVEGLKQYQLVHEQQNQLRVTFTRESQVDAESVLRALKDNFARYLAQHGLGNTVEVEFTEADEIPRDPMTKKIRQIISRVPVPTNADELSGPWRIKGLKQA